MRLYFHKNIWSTIFISIIILNVQFVTSQSDSKCDYYMLNDNILPSNFIFNNCTASVDNGILTTSISAANSSFKASWSLLVNKDIQSSPNLSFSYKVGSPAANKLIGCSLVLVINGLANSATNGSIWHILFNLNGSDTNWHRINLNFSTLFSAWQVGNPNLKYTKVDNIKIGLGTTAGTLDYSGDISFDSITVGNYLNVKSIELSTTDPKQVKMVFSRPVARINSMSDCLIIDNITNNEISDFQQLSDTSLLIKLTNPVVSSSLVVSKPFFKYNAKNLNFKDSIFNQISMFPIDSIPILLDNYLIRNYWPHWGNYNVPAISSIKAQPWQSTDGTIQGWDWSLPNSITPSTKGYLTFVRSFSIADAVVANAPKINFPCIPLLSHWVQWKEIEPVEGVFNFSVLASRIAQATAKGYLSEIRFLFCEQRYSPSWVNNRTDLSLMTDAAYTVPTYDPTNAAFHQLYLAFVDAFATSGLASLPSVVSI